MKSSNTIPGYYFTIPTLIALDTRLTQYEVILYGLISSLCNAYGYCFASNSYLSQLRQVDERTVRRSLSHLVELGYLVSNIDQEQGNKRRIYLGSFPVIYDTPPMDKNVLTPMDKNVLTPVPKGTIEQNTINNLNNYTKSPGLQSFLDLWKEDNSSSS